MTDLHSTPRPPRVLREQVRVMGYGLRRPAALAALLLVAAGAAGVTVAAVYTGEKVSFHPEQLMLPGVAGLLLPIGVWRGEERFGAGFLWTLPVDRRWHALARVGAGWVWLMAAVALFVLWILGLALATGGNVLGGETLRLFHPADIYAAQGTLQPGAWRTIRHAPQPLLWLVPFTSATACYLLASAVALGARHPARWVVGAVLGFMLVRTAGEALGAEWLHGGLGGFLNGLLAGPYGFDTMLTARTEILKVGTTLSTGEPAELWRALPDPGQWAAATLLWTAAGLLALWAAASRHREDRP
ncbi:MAG TPA: hypothetical protein VF613_07340 [Longimicrobium sp.]|jgi:hypothetical protein